MSAKTKSNLPPHDIAAEEAMLGALLIDPDAMLKVLASGLRPEDFYKQAHQWIFRAVLELRNQRQPADFVTVCDALSNRKDGQGSQLDAIGGASEITGLIVRTPTSAYAEHYAQIVQDLAFRRRLITAAGGVAGVAYNWEGTREELQQTASAKMATALDVQTSDSHLYGDDDLLLDYLAGQVRREEILKANPDAFVLTGWHDLDNLLVDIEPGMLHVVASRPGVGKTLYLECVAEYNAQRGKAVAFYHLELSHQTMLDRRMARHSGVPYGLLKRGVMGPKVSQATDDIRQWQGKMVYVHCPGWSAERVAVDLARLHTEGRADIAIVDYLQKMSLPRMARGRNEASLIGQVVGTLKNIAETLGIPILLGSQVTRDQKYRGDKRPRLSDLFGSGLIEAFTNQVVIIHRPEQTVGAKMESLELHVEKNTMGANGKANLLHQQGRFRLVAPIHEGDNDKEMPW